MANDAKKATNKAAAAVAALAWRTGGYDLFLPYLLIRVLAVFTVFIGVSVLYSVRAHMFRYLYELRTVNAMLMIYF